MTSTTTNFLPLITSLQSDLISATSKIATITDKVPFIAQSRSIDYISASLALALNEELAATATASSVVESATAAASAAESMLSSYYLADNLYGMTPSNGGNMAMAIVMGIFMGSQILLGAWFRTWWFGISYFCGTFLEMLGYIGRTLSSTDPQELNPFLIQIICLTIAPCFIMAGIYYLLGQLIQIYGKQYAILKPLWYTYIFVTCDVISLVIQAAGGGIAAVSLTQYESADTGTHIMVGGLAFQVFSMSIFLYFFLDFIWKIRYMRKGYYDMEFEPKYAHVRERKIFKYFPVIIFLGVIFVYVRSIYRVIELAEGWTGFLIVHEVYFMILDALMMALTCVMFIPFHPGFVLGKGSIPVEGTRAYSKMIKKEAAYDLSSLKEVSNEVEINRDDLQESNSSPSRSHYRFSNPFAA